MSFDVNAQNLPKIDDKLFLMHRAVVMTKTYMFFRFIKVRYSEENTEFYVDACSLTDEPDYTSSIF
jgi:hypothetical protein